METKKHPYDVIEKNRKVFVELISKSNLIIQKAKVVVESREESQRGSFSERWESFPMEPSKAMELAMAIHQKKKIEFSYKIED